MRKLGKLSAKSEIREVIAFCRMSVDISPGDCAVKTRIYTSNAMIKGTQRKCTVSANTFSGLNSISKQGCL